MSQRTFMLMHSSLKKRCWADQKDFHTSLLVVLVSAKASINFARRSCITGNPWFEFETPLPQNRNWKLGFILA